MRKLRFPSAVVLIVALLVLLSAAVQAWATRYEMNEDGTSYVEVAAMYLHGPWTAAINPYWNPLYTWLLALALSRNAQGGVADYASAHLINFVLFLICAVALAFFLGELRKSQRRLFDPTLYGELPQWAWFLLGCALLISCSLDLITLVWVGPDLLLSSLVFGALGAALRTQRHRPGENRILTWCGLGILLGLCYLAKPVGLIVAALLGLGVLVSARAQRVAGWQWAPAVLLFACLVVPYIAFISAKAHRLTISFNGPLTYLFVTVGEPYGYPHGVPLPPGSALLHPPQRLFAKPAAYGFASPVPGSIPIWFDTSYWYEGVKIPFSPRGQIRQLVKNVRTAARIVLIRQAALCVALLGLLLTFRNGRELLVSLLRQWVVTVPLVCLLLLQFLFNLEGRLIAPYLTALWACVLGSFRPRLGHQYAGVLQPFVVAASIFLVINVVSQVGTDAANAVRGVSTEFQHSTAEDRAIAAGMRHAGVPQNAAVAYVGNSIATYWPHIGQFRIAAEIPVEEEQAFIDAPLPTANRLYAALAKAGVVAIISPFRPVEADGGWQALAGTSSYLHFTSRQGSSPANQ